MAREERTFRARMADLGPAIAFVESASAAAGVGRSDALRLAFVVEELFTNTVMHGHGADCDAPVTITLDFALGSVALDYIDSAPAYDPRERLAHEPGALDATVSQRPVGGLGTYLIGRLVETARYAREDGRNRLSVALPLEG
jgi:anti-sigma regulatory factor (Ser/Thr protein kinase)